MYVVTPRCAPAAAVVSAVVLRRPTKECTHPYSVVHRRLPTAGVKVAPHYHQLLVSQKQPRFSQNEIRRFMPHILDYGDAKYQDTVAVATTSDS